MVESKINVKLTENANKPFFGRTKKEKVYEESIICDKDERKDIAPFGIVAKIAIDNNTKILDIKVTARYFDTDDFGVYFTFFAIDNNVYELSVSLSEDNNTIENISLSMWFDHSSFESGMDEDKTYTIDDFTSYDKYLL